MNVRVVAIVIADCCLACPVLNLLLRMGKKTNKSCFFFFFLKCAFKQFVMPPKKKLQADRHTADVEEQNLISTNQRSRLTIENQDMLLRVQKGDEGSVRVGHDEGERQIGAKRKRMLFSMREEEQTWWG